MSAPDEDAEHRATLVAVLELSDSCVTATRQQDEETVRDLLDQAVAGDGHQFRLLLRQWAYLLVDYCGDQMPGWAIARDLASPLELAAHEREFRPPAPGSHEESSAAEFEDTFLRGTGEEAKAYALTLLLRAGVDRDEHLMQGALTVVGGWLSPDQAEIATVLLELVAENLPQRASPSHFTYMEAALFEAAEPERREDLVLPLTRLVALQWARPELGTSRLAIEAVQLAGLDYPTPARRAAAITLLSRALACQHAPGQPILSQRADGSIVSDTSPLDPVGPAAVDILGCRMIALAAAGRAGDIPAALARQTRGNDAQVVGVLLRLAHRLAYSPGADQWMEQPA